MPNETSNAEKLIQLQDDIAAAIKKSPDQEALINKNTAPMLASFDDNDFADAAQLRDVRSEAAETEGKSMGGMMQYNMGGSMLMPPEREGYLFGSVVGPAVKLGSKVVDKISSKLGTNLKDIKKADGVTPSKGVIEHGGVQTHLMGRDAIKTQGRRDKIEGGAKTSLLLGIPTLLSGSSAKDTETEETEEPEVPVYSIEDLPTEGAAIVEYDDGGVTYRNSGLNKVLRKARKNKETEVVFDDEVFNTEALETILKTLSKKESKSMGGKMNYAEGGSMLMPPEMEAKQDMPVDTYDNIPPDEMAAAKASQLPDEEMESNYLTYVLNESLEPQDQEYLMSVLEGDERLSSIFDKVMDVAGEFSGEGKVDGPGTGVSDSIPARLSDGEFVVTEKATDEIGADNLQKMMDEAEQAYDGGYMKKAFGGLTLDPMQDEKQMYGMDQMKSTQDELRKQMLGANRMPSVVR